MSYCHVDFLGFSSAAFDQGDIGFFFFAITYLVPYLPVTPTFLVRFVILIDVYVVDFGRG